ncbi:hypothetical protein FRX31_024491 [Thalictrum thalictroides]|uniref:Uncharacterized protein n=1 Tax=Thalictrum thalictroides TaxID=46969 RepID=A0A7J6VNI6_THATH|nr:hypothetical protein FRX31_024491 [Thalictrum thalictroides]
MGLVFKVISNKNSLWTQWVWTHHLRNKFFWTFKIPTDCSWVWRHVLASREKTIEHILYSISNGRDTLLWHDPWCPVGLLLHNSAALEEWHHRFPLNTKVEALISDGEWNQHIRSLQSNILKESILSVRINSRLEEDRIIWKPSNTGRIPSISSLTVSTLLKSGIISKVYWELEWILETVTATYGVKRNARRFQDKSQSAVNLKLRLVKERRYIQLQVKEIPNTQVLRSLVDRLGIVVDHKEASYIACTWNPHLKGVIKLNCDGAVNDNGNSFGGLMRNWKGDVLCAYIGKDDSTFVFQQELHAVHR